MKTRIERVKLRELKLLDVNARYMRHETFQRLVENVRRDGCLTQTPFAARDGDAYLVLSGNHRVRAAIEAGLEEDFVMLTDDPLSEEQRLALQLAHNAIIGEDDPAILKQLYESIEDIDWREYSGLDDAVLDLFKAVDTAGLSEATLDWTSLILVFLPDELERAREALAEAKAIAGDVDEAWLVRIEDYDRTLNALAETSAAYDIRSQASALSIVLDVFERHRTDLSEGWQETEHKGLVPISSVLGSDRIPASTARALTKALEGMAGRGEIPTDKLWMGLERLVADEG